VDSVLLAIDRPSLMEVVKKHPAIAVAMLRGVAERLRHMNAQLAPKA
jgi:CRP/FNR family transcriptional regulator, cyclic AMP receptor protein